MYFAVLFYYDMLQCVAGRVILFSMVFLSLSARNGEIMVASVRMDSVTGAQRE